MLKKIKRDLSQAEQLFEIFVEGRPVDFILAHEAAEKMGEKFMRQLVAGMKLIKPEVSEAIGEFTGTR